MSYEKDKLETNDVHKSVLNLKTTKKGQKSDILPSYKSIH